MITARKMFAVIKKFITLIAGKESINKPMARPTDSSTLAYAKAHIKSFFDGGQSTVCPCCTQNVKLYPRKITSIMADQLFHLFINRNKWVRGKDLQESVNGSSRNYSLLRFWDLIEQGEESTWMITERGISFVKGEIEVPDRAFVFNNKVIDFSEQMVSYRDVADGGFVGQEYLDDLLDPSTVLEFRK